MTYRTVICVLLVGFVGVALGCGQVTQRSDLVTDSVPASPPTPTVAPNPSPTAPAFQTVEEQNETSATPAVPTRTTDEPANSEPSIRTGSGPTGGFEGELSLEEMIVYHPTVVKARLSYITSETGQFLDSDWPSSYEKYFIVLKFNLTVVEYLKGIGATNIVAVWISHSAFATNADAEAAIPTELAARDGRWDDRDALFFLSKEIDPPYPSSLKAAGYYFLSAGLGHGFEDRYTINSDWRKAWLPAAAQVSSPGDNQEFLLGLPRPGSPTITLGNMKRRIAEITAELNGGDGSEAYKDCVKYKYSGERRNRYRESQGKGKNFAIAPDYEFGSGRPSGTIVHSHAFGYGTSADRKARFWLDGRDSTLFNAVEGQHVPAYDGFKFDLNVVAARPIPAGSYQLNYQFVPFGYADCDHAFTTEFTVNVTAPSGTLHELFFDSVGVGARVGADATNGVIEPVTFTDSNGASATLSSISYEAGTVKMEVTPNDALAGHTLDIIELDGTVSLSLDVADAMVDSANYTLSWSVSSQPWEDGDLLMVRIRKDSE